MALKITEYNPIDIPKPISNLSTRNLQERMPKENL